MEVLNVELLAGRKIQLNSKLKMILNHPLQEFALREPTVGQLELAPVFNSINNVKITF